jgi:hypothetical protein
VATIPEAEYVPAQPEAFKRELDEKLGSKGPLKKTKCRPANAREETKPKTLTPPERHFYR